MAKILSIPDAEYHADPAPEPSLSSSLAKVIADQTPAHAWQLHPRLGGHRPESTADMNAGTLLHRLVLGAGAEIDVIDVPHPETKEPVTDWRTKTAREARDAAQAAGKFPVLAHAHREAEGAATAILANLAAAGIELSGESELSVLWQEQTEHGAIWCRSRMDHVIVDRGRGLVTILDLKKIASAHPEHCTRNALTYGYDIQRAAYMRAADMAWPDLAGRVQFRFLFVEAAPPYAVTVADLDALMRERGQRRWAHAVNMWGQCMTTGVWPGYATHPVTLLSPGWLLHQELEAAGARGEDLEL
jgi:hypothetical protein